MGLYHLRSWVVGKERPKADGTVIANLAVKHQMCRRTRQVPTLKFKQSRVGYCQLSRDDEKPLDFLTRKSSWQNRQIIKASNDEHNISKILVLLGLDLPVDSLP